MSTFPHPSPRVVVADDDPHVLKALTLLLEEGAYDVVGSATDGPSAIDMIVEEKPDVAIVDFRMPNMTGVEVAEVFTRACAGVPIIIFSAYDDAGIQGAAHSAGVAAYLVKGCRAHELFSTIDDVLARSAAG